MDEKLRSYTIRRLTPGDAAAIPGLTTKVNGPSYIHSEMYHPERLVRLNLSGELVSVVALDDSDEVVGHYALERPNLELIAESGEAMVLPDHQHHHLLDRMRTMLEEEARGARLVGIFGNTVTHHVFSQKTEERFGAQPIALLLGASPAEAHRDSLPQRVSLLTYFKFVDAPGEKVAFAPRRHQAMLQRIYQRAGRTVVFQQGRAAGGDDADATGTETRIESSLDANARRATIRIEVAGKNTIDELRRAIENSVGNSAAEVIYLDVPLGNPAAEVICETAERYGFFFAGLDIRPPGESDYLKLQFPRTLIDTTLLQIDGAAAREILDYIASERQRIGPGKTTD